MLGLFGPSGLLVLVGPGEPSLGVCKTEGLGWLLRVKDSGESKTKAPSPGCWALGFGVAP